MKKFIFSCTFLLLFNISRLGAQNNVGIGTNTPNNSAMLDISSNTKGLLTPRMTTAQRNAIPSPAKGLLVFDTDFNSFWFHNGSVWTNLSAGGGGGFSLPFEQSVNTGNAAFKINNAGTGAAITGTTTNDFGVGVAGTTNSPYGWGIQAFARSKFAVGLFANSDSGTAIKASSNKGLAIEATSTENSVLKAYSNNSMPVLEINNTGSGTGIKVKAAGEAGIRSESDRYGIQGRSNGGNPETNFGVFGVADYATGLYGQSGYGYALITSGKIRISGGNTNPSNGAILTSDASGNAVWKNNRIAFAAHTTDGSNVTFYNKTPTRVQFSVEDFDFGNRFAKFGDNPSTSQTSEFVAPFNGVYHFDAGITVEFYPESPDLFNIKIEILRGDNVIDAAIAEGSGDSHFQSLNVSRTIRLQSGDRVTVVAYQDNPSEVSANFRPYGARNYFSGHLVFAE